MTAKEFIIKQIDNILSLFPHLKVIYEYEYISKTHYIKILPFESFNNDREYIDFELEFRKYFLSYYPSEAICFLTENSLYDIENPILDKAGILYGKDSYFPILNYKKTNYELFTIISQEDSYVDYDYENIVSDNYYYTLSSKENKSLFINHPSYAIAA